VTVTAGEVPAGLSIDVDVVTGRKFGGSMSSIPAVELDSLEIAWGTTLGLEPRTLALPRSRRATGRAVLEAAVLRALQHAPCAVAFSGGRDSSAVLALALHVARREGLPPPIALTRRFAGRDADESAWQERVIRHVGPVEWQRTESGPDDADLVGPSARLVAARHGVLFPANAYLLVPLLEASSGGALLTGVGGDEVLDSPAADLLQLLALRRAPRRRELRDLTRVLAGRRASLTVGAPLDGRTWLQPSAWEEAIARTRAAEASYPLLWNRALRRWPSDRYHRALSSTLALLAADHKVVLVNPFLEPTSLVALAAEGGFAGFRSRAKALQRLVGDLLPEAVMTRTSKATFGQPLFGVHFRAFCDRWAGDGVDLELVDAERLRVAWDSPTPDFRSALLLQDVVRRTEQG
jgi:hypothetical protein